MVADPVTLGTVRPLPSGQLAAGSEQRNPDEHGYDADGHRADDIGGGRRIVVPLDEQGRIEAEGGKGGESPEDARRQEQPDMLVGPRPISEVSRQEPHRQRSRHVHCQRSERVSVAGGPEGCDIDRVAKGAADSGPEEDDQVKHRASTAAKLRDVGAISRSAVTRETPFPCGRLSKPAARRSRRRASPRGKS